MIAEEDDFTVFVPKDSVAIAVSKPELIPENVSYRILAYNHHSMNGYLERKRQTLIILADQLEPKRRALEEIDRQFASNLFYAFNNFHVRHNNTDPFGLYRARHRYFAPLTTVEMWPSDAKKLNF